MSGLETLSPDQRAVLQLILVQGRGYADLAATLRLDVSAVRERARSAADALARSSGDELDAGTRARIVDYLLGQQDDGERIVTFAELSDSPAAGRWAQDLRERLAGIGGGDLPEVPAATAVAVTNGRAAHAAPPAPDRALPDRSAAPTAAAPAPTPAPPPAARPPTSEPAGPRPSRLGGAILIAGAAALAIVLAIVLIGGGDDNPSASTSGAQTSAQTQTSTTRASARAQARTIGGAVLRSPTGGSGLGAALVQQGTNGGRLLAVEAARLPGNAGSQFYAIWLQGPAGDRFLGFVPNQVRANGTFTVSSALPRGIDLSSYASVLVTSEDGSARAGPTTPGPTVLSGPLRLAR